MLLLTSTIEGADATTGLTCDETGPAVTFDNEYVGNTVLTHYMHPSDPNVYWQGDGYQLDGTIGAAGYTCEAVLTWSDYDDGSWYFNWNDKGAYAYDGDQFIIMVDTNTWTRTDGFTPREFLIEQMGYWNNAGYWDDAAHDCRYWRVDAQTGCYRPSREPLDYPHMGPSYEVHGRSKTWNKSGTGEFTYGTGLLRYTVNQVGMTADGIWVLIFTMINQDPIYQGLLTVGPNFPGTCRYGMAKIA